MRYWEKLLLASRWKQKSGAKLLIRLYRGYFSIFIVSTANSPCFISFRSSEIKLYILGMKVTATIKTILCFRTRRNRTWINLHIFARCYHCYNYIRNIIKMNIYYNIIIYYYIHYIILLHILWYIIINEYITQYNIFKTNKCTWTLLYFQEY